MTHYFDLDVKLPTKIYHYTDEPFEKLDTKYVYQERPWAAKPLGLWVSIEDFEHDITWKTWCEDEKFCMEDLKTCYELKLKEEAKIIYLKSPKEIIEFGIENAGNDPWDFGRQFGRKEAYVYLVNWEQVQKQYDGIIIAPYQWKCRLDNQCSWYYGWDCASGCIWNLNCIEEFKLKECEHS
jgi:hypothetical protein